MSENDPKRPENRGGYRDGAGRKAVFDLGHEKRLEILTAVQAEAEKNKTSFGQELGKLIFEAKQDKRLKLAAMQLYVRDVLPKVSEREVNISEVRRPQIFIPQENPLP